MDRRKAYADVLLNARLDQAALPHADAALLTRTVYGTLRWRGRIDWVLARLLRKPLKDLDPLVRNLLRLGGYELLFLDRVPSYATVNELVELAKRRAGPGKARLVNAVLRQIARRERDAWSPPKASGNPVDLAALVSHPPWLIDMWREQFGLEDSRRLMEANNEEAPLVLRANRPRIARDALVQRLCARGIDARPGTWSPLAVRLRGAASPAALPEFLEGLCQVQGESSQTVGFLADPRPGMRVLDVCAAPGGKTTHMAELMNDRGEIVAATSRSAASQGWPRMPAGWGSIVSAPRSVTRRSFSPGIPAASTGCWWTRRARAWEPCGGIRRSGGTAPDRTFAASRRCRPASWTRPPPGFAPAGSWCTPLAHSPVSRTNTWWRPSRRAAAISSSRRPRLTSRTPPAP